MASPTVFSAGGVQLTASGGLAGSVLASLNKLLSSGKAVAQGASVGANGQVNWSLLKLTPGKQNIIGIPDNATDFTVPDSILNQSSPQFPLVIAYNGNGQVNVHGTKGHPVIVLGDLVLSGGAQTVVATNTGSVNDSATGAVLGFFGTPTAPGNYTVIGSGGQQTLDVANNVQITGTISGDQSYMQIGHANDTTTAVQPNANVITLSGSADTLAAATGTTFVNILGVDDVIYTPNSAETVFATMSRSTTASFTGVGEALVWDTIGGANVTASSNLWYNSNGASASTINATTGADTVFAATGVNYLGANASSLFFVGGAGTASVQAAQQSTLFSGTGNSTFTVGSTSFLLVANSVASGSNTVNVVQSSISGSAAVWTNNNADLVLSTLQGAAGGANTIGAVGSNMTINAMNAAGGNVFDIFTQSDADGKAITGTSTLIGSNAGGDHFNLWVGNTVANGGTIEIMNWQASDKLFVGNVDSATAALSAKDLAAVNAFAAGTSTSLTLSDGTTVVFNVKPTNISHV